MITHPTFLVGKLRHREPWSPAQGHTAFKRQCQNSNVGSRAQELSPQPYLSLLKKASFSVWEGQRGAAVLAPWSPGTSCPLVLRWAGRSTKNSCSSQPGQAPQLNPGSNGLCSTSCTQKQVRLPRGVDTGLLHASLSSPAGVDSLAPTLAPPSTCWGQVAKRGFSTGEGSKLHLQQSTRVEAHGSQSPCWVLHPGTRSRASCVPSAPRNGPRMDEATQETESMLRFI